MKNKFYFIYFITAFLIISCSKEPIAEQVIDTPKSVDVTNLLKTVDGEIVKKIPSDVYQKLCEDLKTQEKFATLASLESDFVKNEDSYVLKDEIQELLGENTLKASQTEFFYKSHIANRGWSGYSYLGQETGTTGQSTRIEALTFSAPNWTSKFKVRVHLGGTGWQSWVGLGEVAGTTGQKRQIEAVQLNVDSSYATAVYYKVHVSGIGWMPLMSNGSIAGTTGQSRRVEAFVLYMYLL